MKQRKDKIEEKYNEYKMKFAGRSEEEIAQGIANLEKQIEEKNNLLKDAENKEDKEKLESIIKKMKQEKDNMSGYNKNKDKIEKIRNYKARLNEKIEPLKEQKSVLEESLKEYQENNKETLENINKTLKDTKKTENMDNEQYNDLLEQKEKIEAGRQEIQKKIDDVQKRIDVLASSMSKCDLAWRSLFNDKSWDEIHARAVNTRYTRKVKDINKEDKNQGDEARESSKNSQKVQTSKKENDSKDMVEVSEFAEKHPILAKFFNWCKRGLNKVGHIFYTREDPFYEGKSEPQDKQDEKQENTGARDAFIEELRRHVENDKADKEQAYIEKHKPKVKTQEEAERD